MISLFKPKKIRDFNPSGLKIYTFNAGFKKKDKDLLLIIFDRIISVCCVYSKTSTPSAPIIWDKKNNKGRVKALVVNGWVKYLIFLVLVLAVLLRKQLMSKDLINMMQM